MKLRLLLGIITILLGAIVALLSVILFKVSKGLEMMTIFVGRILIALSDIQCQLEIDAEKNTDE